MEAVKSYGRPLWVIGSPIDHTLSPTLHNAAFEEAGLPHRYFALEVQEHQLEDFLEAFRRIDGLGANLTLPLKQRVRDYVSGETEAVRSVGAANTLYRSDGELRLDNTDVYGFKKLVEPWHEMILEEPLLLLGAGGAARACLRAFEEIGASQVFLWNRTRSKARKLADQFESLSIQVLEDAELESGTLPVRLVVNSTSLGLDPDDPSPFPREQVEPEIVGVDLIYGHETRFQQIFREYGRDAVGGLGMLIDQAARAWERWTGSQPDRSVMESAVDGSGR